MKSKCTKCQEMRKARKIAEEFRKTFNNEHNGL